MKWVWDSLPDFSKLDPVKTGITEKVDLKMAVKRDSFAVRFESYLHIIKKDLYYLWIISDDGSEVYFNNKLLLENNGLHSADSPKVVAVPLKPGYYPIMIKYFDRIGGEALTFGFVNVKKDPSADPVKKEVLFHREKEKN